MKKWIAIGVISAMSVSMGVFALVPNHQAKKNLSQVTQSTYQFLYLGDKCQQGLNNYKLVEASVEADNTSINNAAQQQVATIKSNASASEAELTSQYNNYQIQYNDAAGNYTEQQQIFNIMNNVTNEIVQAQKDSPQQQLQVLQTVQTQMDKNITSENTIKGREARLSACIDAVGRQQNFSISDVSDIESYIAQSSTKP